MQRAAPRRRPPVAPPQFIGPNVIARVRIRAAKDHSPRRESAQENAPDVLIRWHELRLRAAGTTTVIPPHHHFPVLRLLDPMSIRRYAAFSTSARIYRDK
jgi:hypothetical protein